MVVARPSRALNVAALSAAGAAYDDNYVGSDGHTSLVAVKASSSSSLGHGSATRRRLVSPGWGHHGQGPASLPRPGALRSASNLVAIRRGSVRAVPEEAPHFDVIVAGGGFAGVVAARELAKGRSTLVLEARDRLGGRAWSRSFADTDIQIEMGGQFVYPSVQHPLGREMERYGLGAGVGFTIDRTAWLVGNRRYDTTFPVPTGDLAGLERVVYAMRDSAARIKTDVPLDQQPIEDLDISWSEFLDQFDITPLVRGFLQHVAAIYVGCYPEQASALQLLKHLALFGRNFLQLTPWGRGSVLASGTGPLLQAIWNDASASGAQLELSTPVASIDHGGDRALVSTHDGRAFSADAVVYALPVMCWNDVEVTPALSEIKRSAPASAVAPAGKYWALVDGIEDPPFVVADPVTCGGGYQASVYKALPEGHLYTGFTVDASGMDIPSRAGVEAAVEMFTPGARVLATDGHDWARDPFNKGAWPCFAPGFLAGAHSHLSAPEGRLVFATSDIALEFNAWIAGAIECGLRAAEQAAASIQAR
jgi:monoamine oxidase